MRLTTLASGSSGNAIYLGDEKTNLLIDCGLTGKKTKESLKEIKVNPETVDGILVTHEHRDHIHGVGVLSRKYDLPIYATEKTWYALGCSEIGRIAEKNQQYLTAGKAVEIGEMKLEVFATSHDAVEPIGVVVYKGTEKVGVATDTGCITAGMEKHLKDCNILLIEANHDEEMLEKGPYPHYLKKRIRGQEGHLDNVTTGNALTRWISGDTQQIVLAHLSKENNLPYLARKTVEDILTEAGINAGVEVQVTVAPREETHPLVEVIKPYWPKSDWKVG
ncbi:MAG: MBL fold metallo-hydrolase [Clostridia bacterium]|nr:MBL fold metallo-hydrolase [Clostridia bacterium]